MSSGGARPLLLLSIGFVIATAIAGAARWSIGAGWFARGGFVDLVGGWTGTMLVATAASLLLFLAFRGASTALRRRNGPSAEASLLPLENITAVLVALLVVFVIVSGAGTALVSLGLVGFGVTLALQRPLLAMAGWATIRFGRLFREGDRIEVDGLQGDVLDIGLFSTRMWEMGGTGPRATGRIVTLSNAIFVEKPVFNATSDIPYVFDEFAVSVAYEADWQLAQRVLKEIAADAIDPRVHAEAAVEYERLAYAMPNRPDFPREPTVMMSLGDSWIELRLRYLVDIRQRSPTRTSLAQKWQEATGPHGSALPNVYPRVQTMAVAADGRAFARQDDAAKRDSSAR